MLKKLISTDVLEYSERTGFQFSDSEIATIIYHSEMSVQEKHLALQSLADRTEDIELQQQIAERIAYDRMCCERFSSNDGSCFYEISAGEETDPFGLSELSGYFATVELAISYGKSHNLAFTIQKYQIIGRCETIILPHGLMNPRLFPEATFGGHTYDGEPIAGFCYDAAGELKRFWTYEITSEEDSAVNDWGARRFEQKFIRMPNPFERGDIVRMTDSESIGTVATSQEEWHEFLRRVETRNLPVDFSDTSVVVEFQDGTHAHIQPIYLEKVD